MSKNTSQLEKLEAAMKTKTKSNIIRPEAKVNLLIGEEVTEDSKIKSKPGREVLKLEAIVMLVMFSKMCLLINLKSKLESTRVETFKVLKKSQD